MDSKIYHRSRKILTLEQKVKALEKYDIKRSSRKVGEAFDVSKDEIQKLVRRKADEYEEYSGNTLSHSQHISRKIGNDELNELTRRWFQGATTRRVQFSGRTIDSASSAQIC